ncbi:MAG: hypothetical protein CMJ35_09585 [Phycisphaerae bacterium]|nr:hypothetical protein [Phycisphaerae bacterium]MBM91846.1 hypothetical protein [Phycisphaerae bacterium]
MLTIAILITILGLLVLMLGLRGRIAQRGTFCRRCRFDLAGIETHGDDAKCPECGRPIGTPGTTRSVRRAKSKGVIVLSVVLLLMGIGVGAVALTGNTSKFYEFMPNRVVLFASQWGVDEALDELLARLGATKPNEQWVWDDAIKLAMDSQADRSLTWNPRWGEIISRAWQGNHLSEEQKLQIATNAYEYEYLVRDRVRIDAPYISHTLKEHSARHTAITQFQTGYKLRFSDYASGGRFGDQAWENPVGGSMSSTFSFPRQGFTGHSAMGGGITVPSRIREQLSVGDELEIYYEFQLRLERLSDTSITESVPIRFERTVRVIGAGEPIVQVIDDPVSAKAITKGASIEPLTGVVLGSVQYGRYDELAATTMNFTHLPEPLSGEVFLQHPIDGERVFVGTVALQEQPKKRTNWTHSVPLPIHMGNETDMVETIRRVTRDGVVDVIFQTDPKAAERNPMIDEVVDLEFHFDAVPVEWFESMGEMYQARVQSAPIPASEHSED